MAHARPNIALELSKDGVGKQLAADYYAAKGRAASGTARSDALAVLEGQALQQSPEQVFLRMGRAGDSIVIDLGTPDGQVVVVSSSGWKLEAKSPVLFRRNGLGLAFVLPVKGGEMTKMRALLNVDDSQFRLLVGWLVATFLPDVPQPILVITGQQGTAKTTTAKMLLSLFDPSEADVQSQPSNEENWAVAARAVAGIGLDNISRMPPWFQDALCKVVTGGAFVRRARYSDDSPSVLKIQRAVVLTTINPGALQGDVADRMLKIELAPVTSGQRRDASEVATAFEQSRGETFGALLALLVEVLRVLPEVELSERPRMADFAGVLAALDKVTGWTTLQDYLSAVEAVARDVVDGDSFATALVDLVREQGQWTGTCGSLLAVVEDGKHHQDWPRTPRGVAEKLQRLAPALQRGGVVVARLAHGRAGTQYRLTAVGSDLCASCGLVLNPIDIADGQTTHASCDPRNEEIF